MLKDVVEYISVHVCVFKEGVSNLEDAVEVVGVGSWDVAGCWDVIGVLLEQALKGDRVEWDDTVENAIGKNELEVGIGVTVVKFEEEFEVVKAVSGLWMDIVRIKSKDTLEKVRVELKDTAEDVIGEEEEAVKVVRGELEEELEVFGG